MSRFPRSILSLSICLFFFSMASAQSVITESGGNVGISNTNPAAKLDVNGNALIGSTKVNIGGSGNGADYPSIGYNAAYTSTADTYNFRIGDSATLLRFGNGSTATRRAFEFKAATKGVAGTQVNFSDLMTILYNGNVGIGTTTPTYKLDVVGSVKINGAGSGIVFPDGSLQTTASAPASGSSIINAINDAGTAGTININRLGSINSAGLADGAVTASKLSAQPTAPGQVLSFDGANLVWSTPSQSGDSNSSSSGGTYIWVCTPAYMVPNSGSNPRTDLIIFNGSSVSANVAMHILDREGNNLAGVTIPGTDTETYPGQSGNDTVPVGASNTKVINWNGPQTYLGPNNASATIRVISDQPVVVSATLQWSGPQVIPCSLLPK